MGLGMRENEEKHTYKNITYLYRFRSINATISYSPTLPDLHDLLRLRLATRSLR